MLKYSYIAPFAFAEQGVAMLSGESVAYHFADIAKNVLPLMRFIA
jgi:hypothetical protein